MRLLHKPGLTLLVALLAACGSDITLDPLPRGAVVLAFGDSLTYGTGAAPGRSYPDVLSDMTGLRIVNAGVPGETTTKGLTRLPEALDEFNPDLVILIHGGNDMLRRQSRSGAAANLTRMIELSRDSGAEVVMLAVPAPGLILSPAAFYGEVAENTGTPIDTDALADILQYPSNKADPIHPNAAGYRMLAERVEDLLKETGALH